MFTCRQHVLHDRTYFSGTNLSGGSTAAPAKLSRRAKGSQEIPDLAIAAERPCLYILPAYLPSSRTPLDTPHRAPARHQPRANSIHCAPFLVKTRKTGPSRRQKVSRRHEAPWHASGVLHGDKVRGSCGRVAVCLRRYYLMWKSRWLMTGVWFGARTAELGLLALEARSGAGSDFSVVLLARHEPQTYVPVVSAVSAQTLLTEWDSDLADKV
jgi:hypothetical protein